MIFHHIGIACIDIEKEKADIEKLHKVVKKSEVIFDKNQKASLCLLELEGGFKIELISGEPVTNILKKNIKYYHLCYEVNNIDESIRDLIKNGAILISDSKQAEIFNNKKVAFLYVSYGLIELLEK
ncbi:MAG: VOC family protein [Smithella sp.]|jgi:methylmalonyl-CoA/ethylmalonyl-CoA epimerase